MNINTFDDWLSFASKTMSNNELANSTKVKVDTIENEDELNKCSPLHISTKSRLLTINIPIDPDIFWVIPVIPYSTPDIGVIKKLRKFNSNSQEELNTILKLSGADTELSGADTELSCENNNNNNMVSPCNRYIHKVTTHLDDTNTKIKYKDIRFITMGIDIKDIEKTPKKKSKIKTFHNCVVLSLRLKLIDNVFKEFHVKLFNDNQMGGMTRGRIEIAGVKLDSYTTMVYNYIINMLHATRPATIEDVKLVDQRIILTNSDFKCGYNVERKDLYKILKTKYKNTIESTFESPSYPGIKCKIFINKLDNSIIENHVLVKPLKITKKMKAEGIVPTKEKKNVRVSVMIFRTGSVLISGNCDEDIIKIVYEYFKNIFIEEKEAIVCNMVKVQRDVEKLKLIKHNYKHIRIK